MLRKVLVVDDSAVIHQMYRLVLSRYQCDIIEALDGQDGLDKLEKHSDADLILLDINMPRMNGLQFIARVKETEKYGHIPIIIMSTEGREEDTARGLALGATGYVKKPFKPDELHALIAGLHQPRLGAKAP